MDILDMIRRMAVVTIRDSDLDPFEIWVEFINGIKVAYKYSVGLHIWAVLNQNLRLERIEGNTDHCVVTPLEYYDLLGFRPGDAVLIRNENGQDKSILFSEPKSNHLSLGSDNAI